MAFGYRFLLLLTALSALTSWAIDYRSGSARAVTAKGFGEDRVARVALQLGRSTGAISEKRAKEVFEAIENGIPVPPDLANDWQKLLRIAQTQLNLENHRYFFSTGFEYETLKPNHIAWEEFEKGAGKFSDLVEGSFGKQGGRVYEEVAHIRDDQSRKWRLVLEWARSNDSYKSGYELVTPPLTSPEALRDAQAFTWRLGSSKYGSSNQFTGAHQTFGIAPTEKMQELSADPQRSKKILGLVAANLEILQAQYGPAIFEILDVKRNGGPVNPFIRPYIFDHREYLDWLGRQDPGKITLDKIYERTRRNPEMIEREFEVQLRAAKQLEELPDAEAAEMRKWPMEKKTAYRKSWKYRDHQFKFNLKDPSKTLLEIRIADWVSDRPEKHAINTLLQQKILNRAWELAERGEIAKLRLPKQKSGESDLAYWKRIQMDPAASKEALLREVGVKNPDEAGLILGRSFQTHSPKFKTLPRISYGFEVEGWNDDIVEFVVPTDPKYRADWRSLSRKKKLKLMRDLGFNPEKDFSGKQIRALTTEFRVDTEKYPFLHSELHLEASGNWEIKSNGRDIYDKNTLRRAIDTVKRRIDKEEGFGLHVHMFVPQNQINVHVAPDAKKATDLMERMGLHATLQGYAEAEADNAYHALDSWSLDRYSEPDLKAVERHLAGGQPVKGLEQKYHAIAFRPVAGGIDWEFRDLGDNVDQGMMYVDNMESAILRGNFGTPGLEKDKPLFFDFRAYPENSSVTQRFTLSHALGSRRKLSDGERDVLRKLQFEIYKPSMGDYMFFMDPGPTYDPWTAVNEIHPKHMDAKWARTNFENNLAIPLLNWEEQNFLTPGELAVLKMARERYLDEVGKILDEVNTKPRYSFLKEHPNFLHLAEYLRRSEHPSRPDFHLVDNDTAKKQREILDDLTKRLRGEVVLFVKRTKVNEMVARSLPKPGPCSARFAELR